MKSKQPVLGLLLACANTGLATGGTKNDKVSQQRCGEVVQLTGVKGSLVQVNTDINRHPKDRCHNW